jgi:hypothetical protein
MHLPASAVPLLAVVVLACGCARPSLGVENAWSHGVVVRVTGTDGRIGTWWAAPGAGGVTEAEAWADLEPARLEILVADDACTLVFLAVDPLGTYLVATDGTVSQGGGPPGAAALPITSRCAADP